MRLAHAKYCSLSLAAYSVFAFVGCGDPVSDPVLNIPPPLSVGLRPGDGLVVNLQSIPDPDSISVQVDDQGYITLRYIGSVRASGFTESELQQEIKQAYIDRKIYPTIDVSVSVTQRYIHVGGEVARPGRVLWSPDLTLNKAIQEAGGFSLYGKRSGVILTRDEKTYVVDAKLALRNPERDFRVYPGDSVNVPRRM